MVRIVCRRCVLSDAIPGVRFDETGLCNICQQTPDVDTLAWQRQQARQDMEAVIARTRGNGAYDCVVAFSGGKDSSYVLRMLVADYGLRCIAVTIDNGFISDDTFRNCKAVCGAIGVDHMIFTPKSAFMTRMYSSSARDESVHPQAAIQRASSICNSCIGLINSHMLRIAIQTAAPIIAGGYIGGQLPKDTAVLRLNPRAGEQVRKSAIKRFVQHFGAEAEDYFGIDGANAKEIAVINPMLGVSLSEEAIMDSIKELGWKRPADTGITSTNCRLNDLGVYIHSRRHGFHPYVFETADQVRHGLMTREEGLRKVGTVPGYRDIEWLADRLGLGHNEI